MGGSPFCYAHANSHLALPMRVNPVMAKAIVSARCVRELARRNALIARAGDMNRVHTAMELDTVSVSIAYCATELAVRSVTIAVDKAIVSVLHAKAQDVLNVMNEMVCERP